VALRRCALRRARALGCAAGLAALVASSAQNAWARPAAAKPPATASAEAASLAPSVSTASAASAAAPPSAPLANASARFGFYGLRPAQAGQALAQAEAALGQPLKVEAAVAKPAKAVAAGGAAPDCHYRSTAQQPGVRYALAGQRITRVETRDPRYATVSGVHVGDSLERAQQAYGKRLASAPHPYFDQGRMLTVYSPDRRFALVMETNDAGRIITLRGGRLPEVGWLEGCS
jgi:hypothetical protein